MLLDLPINRKGISSSSKWFSVFSQGSEGGRLLKGRTGAASPSNLSHFDGAKSSMSPRDEAAKKDIESHPEAQYSHMSSQSQCQFDSSSSSGARTCRMYARVVLAFCMAIISRWISSPRAAACGAFPPSLARSLGPSYPQTPNMMS